MAADIRAAVDLAHDIVNGTLPNVRSAYRVWAAERVTRALLRPTDRLVETISTALRDAMEAEDRARADTSRVRLVGRVLA